MSDDGVNKLELSIEKQGERIGKLEVSEGIQDTKIEEIKEIKKAVNNIWWKSTGAFAIVLGLFKLVTSQIGG